MALNGEEELEEPKATRRDVLPWGNFVTSPAWKLFRQAFGTGVVVLQLVARHVGDSLPVKCGTSLQNNWSTHINSDRDRNCQCHHYFKIISSHISFKEILNQLVMGVRYGAEQSGVLAWIPISKGIIS